MIERPLNLVLKSAIERACSLLELTGFSVANGGNYAREAACAQLTPTFRD
jgi:hypothetical protein